MLILAAAGAAVISVILTLLILKNKYDKRLSDFQDSVLSKFSSKYYVIPLKLLCALKVYSSPLNLPFDVHSNA